jgi:hypothetical protein
MVTIWSYVDCIVVLCILLTLDFIGWNEVVSGGGAFGEIDVSMN